MALQGDRRFHLTTLIRLRRNTSHRAWYAHVKRRRPQARFAKRGSKMSLKVRNVEYFYVRIHDAEKAYEILARLASVEVNLLAFSAIPYGPNHVELTIFPDQSKTFIQLSEKLGWKTTGPLHALLVQG